MKTMERISLNKYFTWSHDKIIILLSFTAERPFLWALNWLVVHGGLLRSISNKISQRSIVCDGWFEDRYSLLLQAKASFDARSIKCRADFSGAHKINLGTDQIATFNVPYRLEGLPFTATYSCQLTDLAWMYSFQNGFFHQHLTKAAELSFPDAAVIPSCQPGCMTLHRCLSLHLCMSKLIHSD